MKKLLLICVTALLMLSSCTIPIEKETKDAEMLDKATQIVLNLADSTHIQSCVILDDAIVILPKKVGDDIIVVKNYDPLAIVFVTIIATAFAMLLLRLVVSLE